MIATLMPPFAAIANPPWTATVRTRPAGAWIFTTPSSADIAAEPIV
jgi:hypothetical protein